MKHLWNKYSYTIVLFAISLLAAFMLSLQIDSPESENYIKITVNEGDSLWKIAEEYSNEHTLAINDFIHWVQNNNGIADGRIYPGEEIIIPVLQVNETQTELASLK
jgi:LysM repeat protein